MYLTDIPEAMAIRFAETVSAAFGTSPPRGMRHLYRQQFISHAWAGVDRDIASVVAVKLPDIMPMQRGLAGQEEIRHSWAYGAPRPAALRNGLRPIARATSTEWIKRLFSAARKNAAARGIAFDLTPEDVGELVAESRGRCAVTGVALSTDRGDLPTGRRMRRPWAPSLDRKDSAIGYTRENCRVVCCAANYAMSQWGEEVLLEMAKAIARKRIKRLDRVVAG